MQNGLIYNLFGETINICSLLKKYDKSYFNDGTDQAVFSEWERNNSVAIP